MKRILFCLLMLAFALPSQSESLYGEGTRWEVTERAYDESEYKHCATFEVLGDTVIDAIIYKKVYKTYLGESSSLFAVIRETPDSIIYIRAFDIYNYEQGLMDEMMLYDFSKWDEGLLRMTDVNSFSNGFCIRNIALNAESLSEVKLADSSVVSSFGEEMPIIRGIGIASLLGPLTPFDDNEYMYSAPFPYFYRFYRNGRLLYENPEVAPANNVIPDGRRWIYREYRPLYPPYGDRIEYFDAKGDTIINGNKYSVISPDYDAYSYVRWEGTKCLRYWPITQRDTLVFDESWNVGDTTIISDGGYKYRDFYEVDSISEVQDRKFWWTFGIRWLQGIGFIGLQPFYIEFDLKGGVSLDLICCIDPGNDTLYVNRDLLHLLKTNIENISADDVSFKQQDDKCIVTLPADASAWSATLYNSSGVTVARRSGEGDEIILPATSKGTHILVLNIDGRVVKKKVFIK